MKPETKNIGFACFLGAFIGALSLKIADWFASGQFIWPLGAVIGGATGYLAYEPLAVVKAIRKSWLLHFGSSKRARAIQRRWFFRAKFVSLVFITLHSWILGVVGIVTILAMIVSLRVGDFTFPDFIDCCLSGITASIILAIIGTLAAIMPEISNILLIRNLRGYQEVNGRLNVPIFNPAKIILPIFSLATWQTIGRGLITSGRTGIEFGILLGVFFWIVLIQIHSSKRVICLCDSFLGALVGFQYHDPLVGAVTGCILGILNYEIVSVRWLKLVPSQN